MSARPTLALVIPAWNAARFLPGLFASIAAQIEPFDEIVLCDDASTDDTATLARSLGARVVQHARNAGCSAAKNTGLAAVQSDWVHFQDADDLLLPRFTAVARSAVCAATDAWIPRWRHVDASSGALLAESRVSAALLAHDPVAANLLSTINNVGVYRTDAVRAIGGFAADPCLLHNEDRAFHLALAQAGARFTTGDMTLVETRLHAGSMSAANQIACLRAHGAVTRAYVERNPGRHRGECAAALWQAATGLASVRRFDEAGTLVELAARLGHSADPAGSARFRLLCRLGPSAALRLREYAIRVAKPWLRRA